MSTAHIPLTSPDNLEQPYDGPPRNVTFIDQLDFDDKLQPKNYSIAGTSRTQGYSLPTFRLLMLLGKTLTIGDVLIIGKSP